MPIKDIVNVNGGPDMIWVREGEAGDWVLVPRGPRPDQRVRPPTLSRKHAAAAAAGAALLSIASPPLAVSAATAAMTSMAAALDAGAAEGGTE